MIERNQCPACGNYGFHMGPRGGLSRNIFCANPDCRAGFNVAFLGQTILMCQAIQAAEDKFYPPLVHFIDVDIDHQMPVCRFTMRPVADWPLGHGFIIQGAWDVHKDVTCPQCLALLR